MEVGACLGAEVGDHVVAAVDVGQSLVEADVKHGELVVVAEQALEERKQRRSRSICTPKRQKNKYCVPDDI